jgi:hypothetical protein
MSDADAGSSPIDRLASHYEDRDVTCPECGFVDEDATWKAKTNGRRIDYRYICPCCGDIRIRTLTLET